MQLYNYATPPIQSNFTPRYPLPAAALPHGCFLRRPRAKQIHLGYGNTNLHNAVTNRGEGYVLYYNIKNGGYEFARWC